MDLHWFTVFLLLDCQVTVMPGKQTANYRVAYQLVLSQCCCHFLLFSKEDMEKVQASNTMAQYKQVPLYSFVFVLV